MAQSRRKRAHIPARDKAQSADADTRRREHLIDVTGTDNQLLQDDQLTSSSSMQYSRWSEPQAAATSSKLRSCGPARKPKRPGMISSACTMGYQCVSALFLQDKTCNHNGPSDRCRLRYMPIACSRTMQIIIDALDCSYMCVFLAIGPKASVGVFSRSADGIADPPGAAERGHGGRTTVFVCSPDPEFALWSRRAAAWQQAANSFKCKQPTNTRHGSTDLADLPAAGRGAAVGQTNHETIPTTDGTAQIYNRSPAAP